MSFKHFKSLSILHNTAKFAVISCIGLGEFDDYVLLLNGHCLF